nr:hypothetical protein [Tanacetum cinerariifolium]
MRTLEVKTKEAKVEYGGRPIPIMDKGKFKPPPQMTTPVEKRNASKLCEFHGEVGHTTDKLISFPTLGEEDGAEGLMIIEAEIRGHYVHHIYVDGGSSSEILYEHCFSKFHPKIKNQREYDIWAMKLEHYLSHIDYLIWQVIQNGNGHVSVTTNTNGMTKVLPLKTAEVVVARERERKARTTLLMALPRDHLAKFHKMADTKRDVGSYQIKVWCNDESKKMQKYLLKQQFKGFSMSTTDGLHKGYDRFQTLLSQLEIHGAGVLHEDANQKFLRSLPSSWSQVALIMRTKPGLDTLSFDDLYNNLRVFKRDVKGTTTSSSNIQNVAFVSTDNTSSTNDVSTAYSVSYSSVSKSQKEGASSYTDEVIHSFFANQSSAPQLDYDDLEQINDDDMEEIEL